MPLLRPRPLNLTKLVWKSPQPTLLCTYGAEGKMNRGAYCNDQGRAIRYTGTVRLSSDSQLKLTNDVRPYCMTVCFYVNTQQNRSVRRTQTYTQTQRYHEHLFILFHQHLLYICKD